MKAKRVPGVKVVRIGNRVVALPDAQVRDLLRAEKKPKKLPRARGS